MNLEILAETLDIIGASFIAWAALRVHHRVLKEHKIDKWVFRIMKFEQKLGILGVILIILSYLIKLNLLL